MLTAAVALPILIVSIIFPSLWWLFATLAGAAMFLGLWEFHLLAKKRNLNADRGAMFLAGAAIFVVFLFPSGVGADLILIQLILIVFTIAALSIATLRSVSFENMLPATGATILGVLYVVFLGAHLVGLRTGFSDRLSTHLLSFFFLILMGADAGAYYVGRAFGKHKLAPRISPGKTWEGVVGGFIAALVFATIAHFWFFRELPLRWALPLAAIMTVLGILGDLTESALKRGAGAKDAANILPGHGGILDRLDSLLFNAPLIYYFARFYFDR